MFETLSLFLLAITELRWKLGQYSSPKTIPQGNSTQHRPSLIAISKPLNHHLRITHNAPCLLLSPKICLRIVFNLSWDDCCTQEKIGNNGYAKFWGKNRQYYMGTVKMVMLNSIEVLHWCQNSLQCRRFLWACNLPVKAPCWNFPKRGGDGAEREKRNLFFSPLPSPLSFFRPRTYRKGYYFYSPQSSTVIKSKMAATTILRTGTRFRPPKIRLHCRLVSKEES